MSGTSSSTSSVIEPRVAVVTGASAGIGAVIARALGALGWTVALGARRLDRLEEVAESVRDAGGTAFVAALDVGQPAAVDSFFSAVEQAVGAPDVVVNNAGLSIPGFLHELEPESLQEEVATNLLGPMLVSRRALPSMLRNKSGDIVFITSLNAVVARPLQVAYTATKTGLEAAARTLQMELEGTGVRATIIRPGPTMSEFGFGWDSEMMTRVLESWSHWGVLRHNNFLPAESIAAAVVQAVTAEPGTQLDLIQLNPTAPQGRQPGGPADD